MMLNNYMEQHENIRKQVEMINGLVGKNNLEENAFEIATHISRLAGIINIHLSSEDKHFYPGLIEKGDEKVSKMAVDYQKEMGHLLEEFTSFKARYNTRSKIMDGSANFVKELGEVVAKLEQRMKKEENGIYKLIG